MNNPEEHELISSDSTADQRPDKPEFSGKTTRVTVSRKRYIVMVAVMSAVIFSLLALVLAVILSTKSGNSAVEIDEDQVETCWTKECLGFVAMVKNNQNESMAPCDDFYTHACGRFHEHQVLTAPVGLIHHKMLENHIYTVVRNHPKYSESHAKEQLRQFARACSQKRTKEEEEREEVEDLWKDIEERGGFPLVDSRWDGRKFDLSETLSNHIQINRLGLGILSIEPYKRRNESTTQNKLFISPGPHWSAHKESGLLKAREDVEMIVKNILHSKPNRTFNRKSFNEHFQKAVDFEEKLMELADYSSMTYYSSDPDNIKTLSDLISEIPEIDWIKILSKVPNDGMIEEDRKTFLGKVDVLGGPYFFGEHRELVHLITKTPNVTLANYLAFRHLIHRSSGKPDRNCARQLLDVLPMPAMSVFVESVAFKMEHLRMAANMFEAIQSEYLRVFEESDWLDDELKGWLGRKLAAITVNFGYHEYFENADKLEGMYETMNLSETDSTWRVYMKVWRHQSEQIVEHIVHNTRLNPVHRNTFRHHAAYIPFTNHFDITLPLLSYPFLDASFPSSVNFGSLAVVIGHEIGHAFDHLHRNLDWKGAKNRWWTEKKAANREFETREQCLREQYSAYRHPGADFRMNGTVSRLELVADSLGMKTVFRAFEKAAKTDKFQLPGMGKISNEQMFFYSFAQQECQVPDQNPLVYQTHSHPIYRFRVNGAVQNMPEFADAFQCPVGSPMNPKAKCRLL